MRTSIDIRIEFPRRSNFMISKAIMFATLAHENKKRKVKDIPYILHPMEAAAIVSQMI